MASSVSTFEKMIRTRRSISFNVSYNLAILFFIALSIAHIEAGTSKASGSVNPTSGNADGTEEIVIPLGGTIDLGGLGGGGFEIPLDPTMMMPPQGGSMGFEETEEIGPDGKPHIISQKSFGGPLVSKKLTKEQQAQQKALQKEMAAMATDMTHMFSNGDFGFAPQGGAAHGNDDKYQQDLFKNAMKTFSTAEKVAPGGGKRSQSLSNRPAAFPSGVAPADDGHRWGAGAAGNSTTSHVWIGLISIVAVVVLGFVAFRYYKTNMGDVTMKNMPYAMQT